ncbi:MAG TPA: HPr family phosphocarrier protein [bacterium]|jgi:phosphocarrier protein HPr|nr:HPr family phosphocarrier protein [bacterium]
MSNALQREIPVVNKLGLHLRAAAQFVQTAGRFPCDVWVSKDGRRVNGKSIMGVMTLVAVKGSSLMVEAEGDKAAECLEALVKLASDRFGEKE